MGRTLVAASLLLVLARCGAASDSKDAGDTGLPDGTTGGDAVVVPDLASDSTDEADGAGPETFSLCDYSACAAGTRWTEGTPIFREATTDWGLAGLKVEGTMLSVTDLDGDDWPDLLVRNGGGPDMFGDKPSRQRWVLRNTGNGAFEDVTEASGLFTARYADPPAGAKPGEVVASADVDNDGDLDIIVANAIHKVAAGQETTELMLNQGDGTFILGPADSELRFEGRTAVPAGLTFVDFDRDGFVDVWMVHNMVGGAFQPLQDRLFKGDGTGRFVDVTYLAGLRTKDWRPPIENLNQALGHSWGWGAAACDLNNDGVQELLAASYGRAPNHLWQGAWLGPNQVEFKNVSVYSGYAYDQRMDWTDNESARCFCKLHREAQNCADVPEPQYMTCETDADIFRWDHEGDREPWRLGGNSASTSCVDVDNDGNVDLFTGEIVHWDVGSSSDPAELLFNTGEAKVRFERPGNEDTGLVREYPGPIWDNGDMKNAVFDFDNDGWADIYISSSDYPYTKGWLFHQESPRVFKRVAFKDYFEHLRSAGVVFADFDRDGDLDIVVGHSRFRCGPPDYLDDCYETQQVRFFENLSATAKSNWVQLRLEGGAGTNRAAIGARVTVTTCETTQTRNVDGGHGHFGVQDDLTLHFGLGAACHATVQIRWPDAGLSTQEFNVEAGHRYRVVQGAEPIEEK